MSSAKSDNIALITFEDESKAFQALSMLKRMAAERTIELKGVRHPLAQTGWHAHL